MTTQERRAVLHLIREAEEIMLTLEQDDLRCGEYPHLRRAIAEAQQITAPDRLPHPRSSERNNTAAGGG
jgi:hypothetical protein